MIVIILGILIVIGFLIEKKYIPQNIKSVGTAYILWIFSFFGVLGFHRFYLGKYGTGFLWMFTSGLLGIGAFVDLLTLSYQVKKHNILVNPYIFSASKNPSLNKQFETKQNVLKENPKHISNNSNFSVNTKTDQERKDELVQNIRENLKISKSSIAKSNYDESIIDVTNQSFIINSNNNLKKYHSGVPYWAHHYVYSYSELKSASAEQYMFYNIFKINFLDSIYFDLEGNSNYAFILLFDLINDYDTHKDISKLESHLKILGHCYPITKSYCISLLNEKIELDEYSDEASILKLDNKNNFQNYNSIYDSWRLGNKYRDKLELDANEVRLLNSLIDTDNKFNSIQFCAIEIIRLLINCIKELEEYYKKNDNNFQNVINDIAHIEITSNYNYKSGSYNYNSIFDNFRSTINQCLYKTCENALREYLKVGRKTEMKWYLRSENASILFNDKILLIIEPFINLYLSEKKEIDLESEIKINNYSRSRYKYELNHLAESFDSSKLLNYNIAIENLELRNEGNPFIENIYFEASKFIAKYDKSISLKYYIKYLYHDLNSATFDNKQLTKTIQKTLFKTNEQLHEFERIVSELIKDRNLVKALNAVTKIHEVKRKKIHLDRTTIKEVQEQHSGTVELLNEYLRDEYEDENISIQSQEISSEEIKIEIFQKNEESHHSLFLSGLTLNPIHSSILELFSKNNFSIPQIEIEEFAKFKGVFKNQIIDSINEICFDELDDVLIEDEDDYYTINPDYFQKILAK